MPSPARTDERALYRPTPITTDAWATEQVQAGMAVLLREKNLTAYAEACRDCARGLLDTARKQRAMGQPDEVARLVRNARWYWQRYIWEIVP